MTAPVSTESNALSNSRKKWASSLFCILWNSMNDSVKNGNVWNEEDKVVESILVGSKRHEARSTCVSACARSDALSKRLAAK
ncbi:hypothetical protein RB195_014945 [Necator americanus]|uniref:Uncharacterized protein n=1 Tax=Necator americanus TaxID=51031 RepID=A0ABR1E2B1_NECAM